jgi:hypothetical protein
MRDTIDMAREAGIELDLIDEDEGQIWYITTEGMKAFEALVRADEREQGQKWFDAVTAQHKQLILAEREACAKVCEGVDFKDVQDAVEYADVFAAAIRARGKA